MPNSSRCDIKSCPPNVSPTGRSSPKRTHQRTKRRTINPPEPPRRIAGTHTRANAHAERTLRHELLDPTIIRNEKQLRALLAEYIDHYNQHRHRGIDQRAPNDTADVVQIRPSHPIQRPSRCGGLINEYRTAA